MIATAGFFARGQTVRWHPTCLALGAAVDPSWRDTNHYDEGTILDVRGCFAFVAWVFGEPSWQPVGRLAKV